MAVCIVLGAQPAIDVIGGSDFDPAVPVLRIQGVAVAASFLVAVWATGLWATRGQRTLVVANLIGVAAAAGLTAALIPSEGAQGAAIAMTAAELLLVGCYAYALMRERPKLRPALGVVPKTLAAVAAAGALWFVPAPDAVLVVAATAVFFGVLISLRGIPPDVREAVVARRRASAA
jgi:O-antigen/teichoic acid export membrane protein